ncbi:MAG: 3-hydroxyisobutyrate dehydrogenase [Janthinobacterium lividum]
MARIGFIGLGRMGLPMARNLAKAGHAVKAYDISTAFHDAATEAGIVPCNRVDDAIADCEFAITMVPTGRHVHEVHLGEGGVLAKLPTGTLVIDSSTINISEARALHEAGRSRGLAVLDAPVSGGVMGAEAGTLTFMVGGDAADLERARPILEAMGRRIFHAGAAGSGQIAKICNNMMAACGMIVTAEAFALAKRFGMPAETLREIVSVSTGSCFSLTNYPPVPDLLPNVPSSRGYTNGFASALMLKDLRLAEQAGLEAGLPLPLGQMAAALFGMFCRAGHGDLDYSAIIKMIEGD